MGKSRAAEIPSKHKLAMQSADQAKEKSKKRKTEDDEVAVVDDELKKVKLSKDEKREMKRLKKEAEFHQSLNGGTAIDGVVNGQEKDTAKYDEKSPHTTLNGGTEDSKELEPINLPLLSAEELEEAKTKAAKRAARAERKVMKEARKQAKEDEKAGERKKKKKSKHTDGDVNGIANVEEETEVRNGSTEEINGALEESHITVQPPARLAKPVQKLPTPDQISYTEDEKLSNLPESEVSSFLKTNFISITDPTTPKPLRPIISFDHLPFSCKTFTSSLSGFKTPTPIQSAVWPFLFASRDVIGIAETGSGKTLAFGVPCISYILSSLSSPSKNPKKTPKIRGKSVPHNSPAKAVIVSPTRELAMQIQTQMEVLAKAAGLESTCVYGGVAKDPQIEALKTAHIVVGTPGRLNDLIDSGDADLSNVGYLVLDEGDRMLDTGFEQDIRRIFAAIPASTKISSSSASETDGTIDRPRQTLMFTATWPPSVRDLANTFLSSPIHVAIGADNPTGDLRANTRITQLVEVVDPRAKEQRLLQIIRQHQNASPQAKTERILVFCLYKKEAQRVEQFLRFKGGMRVAGIHGDMSQAQRTASLASFKLPPSEKGSVTLLVATDVAARGLDIPAVKLVINATFPLTVEDYVHRIGRTGRAGATGKAITLFTEHDKGQSGALINVLKAAGQEVPEDLLKFGTTVKRKGHEVYGAFYKDISAEGGIEKKATKITFDD
ncbi:RNA-dependent ATPase [Agyrium rufum]|nr:RNA-dependent ATPase [Agyrium rufum]